VAFHDDPLIVGLDIARGGGDANVFRFRRGGDARSIAAIRIPGEEARDTTVGSARMVPLDTSNWAVVWTKHQRNSLRR
jgi:hypothetical protein